MQAFFHFLATNPYILLFATVGLAVWIGRQTIAGYGLGMVAAAIASAATASSSPSWRS
jgi:putative transport protein